MKKPQVLNLGDILYKWRAMSRLGQREAGRILGLSAASVCRIEKGEMKPDGESFLRIINWLMSPVREK